MNWYHYTVFGFSIKSEFNLPNLTVGYHGEPEIKIIKGKNPQHLTKSLNQGLLFESASDDFLFNYYKVGSIRVIDGNTMIIDPSDSITPEELSLYILGTSMGALFHQKGLFPLHGSTIVYNNKAFTFIGKSSSGKSSLAAGFSQQGYEVLSDDLSVIKPGQENYDILPGIPYIKLWKDVIDHLEINSSLNKVRPQLNKYFLPLGNMHCKSSIPLHAIISLTSKNSSGYLSNQVSGVEKFNLLKNNVFRPQFVKGLKKPESHFNHLAEIASTIPMYHIQRPESPLDLNTLVNFVLNQLELID